MNLSDLLNYFNGRLEEERNSKSDSVTVDKAKLLDLLLQVGMMRAIRPH